MIAIRETFMGPRQQIILIFLTIIDLLEPHILVNIQKGQLFFGIFDFEVKAL